MTFVGKVLVVVNVVLTLCIAMFAGGVYTVQTNWKKKYDDTNTQLNQQLNSERAETAKVKEANTALTKALADMTQDKNRFEAQADNAGKSLAARTSELNRMKLQRDQLQTTSDELRKNNDILVAEGKNLRDALAQTHADLKSLRAKITAAEDKIFDLQRKEQVLVKKYNSLLELNITYRKGFVALGGKEEDLPKYANLELKPIPSDGVVEDVSLGGRDKSTLVKVSIGSDDNVRMGTELFVFRLSEKGKYLGKIRIIELSPDSAIGELIDDPKNGKIQKRDNVAPKI